MLGEIRFEPGVKSAGKRASGVKNNLEAPRESAMLGCLNGIVMGRLVSNPEYQRACLPLRVATPYYSRYTQGMQYGSHVDDPVMGEGQRYRSDISITVFLNEPGDYVGGELCIETEFGEQKVKLPAGSAVTYPSSSLHRVAEVTAGERLVAVTWLQSMVRDAAKRRLLYQLGKARESLFDHAPELEATNQVDHTYVNLVRMWGDV